LKRKIEKENFSFFFFGRFAALPESESKSSRLQKAFRVFRKVLCGTFLFWTIGRVRVMEFYFFALSPKRL
jgi:hypothetical protein